MKSVVMCNYPEIVQQSVPWDITAFSRHLVAFSFLVAIIPAQITDAFANSEISCHGNSKVLSCFNSYGTTVLNKHKKQLKAVAQEIANSQEWKQPYDHITVVGHSASFGNNAMSNEYARVRAENVAKALDKELRNLGVNSHQMIEKSLGHSTPIATNDTQKGRAFNRRVEIILSFRGKK